MPRGNAAQTKVHHKGQEDDYIILIDSVEELENWKKDKSVPLAQVVSGFKVFVTHKQGSQGILDAASNASLENEFGTHNEEEVVKQILEKGTVVQSENAERQGATNDSKGGTVAH